MKSLFWKIEDLIWGLRCHYNYWLHGPYGLAKVIERMPFRFIEKYLRKYGATIGENCRFERGLNLHRPTASPPFKNLKIGNGVYLGHNTLFDLTEPVVLEDKVIVASHCQFWTHASIYQSNDFDAPAYDELTAPVRVCKGAIIYSNVLVGAGVTIGAFARVGANSLVNKNVEEQVFVGGVPAKQIGKVNEN